MKDIRRTALQQAMVNGISHPLPSTDYRGYGTAVTHTHARAHSHAPPKVYINWFFASHRPHMMWDKSVLYHWRSNINICKPFFVIYCQYNCETGVLLYNMKRETFHLKVVAGCSITIRSTSFTGAQYWCCPEKESYCMLHSAGNTLGSFGWGGEGYVKGWKRWLR
jgi:hypothetical protein